MQNKKFPYALFFAILLMQFVPSIYETVRTLFISKNTVDGFSIAGHMEWFDLIHEIVLTMCVFPLYYLFKKYSEDKGKLEQTIKTILITFSIVYVMLLSFVLANMDVILETMKVKEDLEIVKTYLSLETISLFFQFIYSILFVLLVVFGYTKIFYTLLIVKTIGLIATDAIFIPQFGVNGIAYSNIIFSILLVVLSTYMIWKKTGFNLKKWTMDFEWIKEWFKVGGFAGGQIFLDNFMYAMIVMQMVNALSAQGDYWVANNFIWGMLLIPVMALNEIVKKEAKEKQSLKKYFSIVIFIIVVWVATSPLWETFFLNVYGLDQKTAEKILAIIVLLLPYYATYLVSSVIDNYFYGLGKTQLPLINSAIVNGIYYPLVYVFYKEKEITVTMEFIVHMFGIGMVIHLLVSIIQLVIMKKNEKNL